MAGTNKPLSTNILKRELYLACRRYISVQFKDDTDAIKAVRDEFIDQRYNRNYTELDKYELCEAIDQINFYAKYQSNFLGQLRGVFASDQQQKTIRFLGLSLAIEYMDWSGFHRVNYLTGEVEQDCRELQARVRKEFASGTTLNKHVYMRLHRHWLNPKCHEILIEARLKTKTTKPENFYYHHLKMHEADCIIQKLTMIYHNKFERTGDDFVHNAIWNN